MRAELIQNWSDFFTLEKEWNELLSCSRADTIFLTWEWIRSWGQVVGKSIRPFVVCVRDANGRLVGLSPFYHTEYRLLKTVPYRVLRIMADFATGAEYPDWIVSKVCETEAVQAIVEALVQSRRDWDCIWMPNVAGWIGAKERIFKACQAAGFYHHERPRDFGFFRLPDDMETYVRSLSGNRRSQLRRQVKRVMGDNGVSVLRCQTTDELPRFLDALFELHHRRWKQKGDEGTFRRKPDEALFYEEFTMAALEKGWLWLFGLEEHGEFKAIQIGYVYNNVFHQLQEGFDPDYVPGAGNVLRAKVIEACIAAGVKAYDFLGEMTEHKRQWLAKKRTGYDLFIGHRNMKNTLLFAKEIWPTGRFLRPVNLPTSCMEDIK